MDLSPKPGATPSTSNAGQNGMGREPSRQSENEELLRSNWKRLAKPEDIRGKERFLSFPSLARFDARLLRGYRHETR